MNLIIRSSNRLLRSAIIVILITAAAILSIIGSLSLYDNVFGQRYFGIRIYHETDLIIRNEVEVRVKSDQLEIVRITPYKCKEHVRLNHLNRSEKQFLFKGEERWESGDCGRFERNTYSDTELLVTLDIESEGENLILKDAPKPWGGIGTLTLKPSNFLTRFKTRLSNWTSPASDKSSH